MNFKTWLENNKVQEGWQDFLGFKKPLSPKDIAKANQEALSKRKAIQPLQQNVKIQSSPNNELQEITKKYNLPRNYPEVYMHLLKLPEFLKTHEILNPNNLGQNLENVIYELVKSIKGKNLNQVNGLQEFISSMANQLGMIFLVPTIGEEYRIWVRRNGLDQNCYEIENFGSSGEGRITKIWSPFLGYPGTLGSPSALIPASFTVD